MEETIMKRSEIHSILKEKVLVLDGAYGSEFIKRGFEGTVPPEVLNLRKPGLVRKVHEDYINAGAEIILTNTFGATPHKLGQYGIENHDEVIRSAVRIARVASKGRALVFGDVGPTGEMPYPVGNRDFDFFFTMFRKTTGVMLEEGIDGIILETFSDIFELKAAVLAVRSLSKEVFLVAHLTFEESGRTLTGTEPANFALTFSDLDVDALGINCTLGPEEMSPLFKELAQRTEKFLCVEPNAGMPILDGEKNLYPIGPDEFSQHVEPYWECGANIIGGCCGTTPEHIKKIKTILGTRSPAVSIRSQRSKGTSPAVSSPLKIVDFDDFVVIGEGINPSGGKRLKRAIEREDLDYVLNEARRQVDAGATVLDVNFGIESAVSPVFMEKLILALSYNVGAPLSLDVQTPEILERLMKVYPGRPLVNSSRAFKKDIEKKAELLGRYGGVLIILSMGKDVPKGFEERKERIDWAMNKIKDLGLSERRIIFDPIVLAMGAGGNPLDTLRTVSYLSEMDSKSTYGLSNLSFGLPDKSYLNAAFLALSLEKGLTSAIMNALDPVQMGILRATLVLLGKKELPGGEAKGECELVQFILSGKKDELLCFVKEFLCSMKPIRIVEEHLKPGMERVGEMYSSGTIYLPQLILAAQTIKPAFEFIESKLVGGGKENFVIATVSGDVHDIGKNIVAAIIRSSGFNVVDLGKDVSTEEIVKAVKKNKPLALGLSAMMTTTIPKIKDVVEGLKHEGVEVVVIAGGASLSKKIALELGADFYAKDAMDGLRVLKELKKN